MGKIFFKNSNYSCDDDVTNFVKFIKKTAKIRVKDFFFSSFFKFQSTLKEIFAAI